MQRSRAPGSDPYPADGHKHCLFVGNVYGVDCQPEANRTLIAKLNRLGERLLPAGIRLFLLCHGDTRGLDTDHVTHLGAVSLDACWNFLHHADVGIVVSAGAFMRNNESTKIYHYLRAGLPVVSESGFPNDHVVIDSGGGCLVDHEDMDEMARQVARIVHGGWDMQRAVRYVLDGHTWDHRAQVYRRIIPQ